MPVVISDSLVLQDAEAALSLDHPIIGWHNIVTTLNLVADTEDADYPATNLANPATHLSWKESPASPQADVYITVTTGTADDLDYLAIARHNLWTVGATVSVGYFNTASPPQWVELVGETTLPNDGPALFRWTAQPLTQVILKISGQDDPAQVAVLYVGKLLVLPRRLYQGMGAINHGRVANVTNGMSEAGHFTGRIVTQERLRNTVPLSLIDPAYYRAHIDEFLEASKELPFFMAWRPQTYPNEVGYCHLTNDPLPVNEAPHGLIAMTLEMTAAR